MPLHAIMTPPPGPAAAAAADDAALHDLFSHDLFTRGTPTDPEESGQLTYQRMRAVADYLSGDPLGGGRARLLAVQERSAVVDPALFHGLLVHYQLAMETLVQLGSGREDLADELERMRAMASIGSFMITEIGNGNSHASPATEAVYDPERNEFVLHTPHVGAQKFPPNVGLPGLSRLAVVFATVRVDSRHCGVFPFLVPVRDEEGPAPGVSITPLPATNLMPLDYAVVSFDRVRVPYRSWLRDTAVIDPEGGFRDPLTSGERLARSLVCSPSVWAAISVGCAAVCRAAVALALRHSFRRTAIGRLAPDQPVISYRNQQRDLFGALATAYAVTALAEQARKPRTAAGGGAAGEGSSPWVSIHRTQSLGKVLAARAAEEVTAVCRRASGAMGFFSANRFLGYQGMAHAYRTAGGDSQLILLDTARALVEGADYQPPTAPVVPTQADLLDPALWSALAAGRERLLHERLAAELKGRETFAAWNDHASQALELAEAHAARLALETLLASGDASAQLLTLHAFHALSGVAEHAAWYQCEGMLTAEQRHLLTHTLNLLCDRLLEFAPALVDALDVPSALLAAPLAAEDYRTAFTSHPSKDSF